MPFAFVGAAILFLDVCAIRPPGRSCRCASRFPQAGELLQPIRAGRLRGGRVALVRSRSAARPPCAAPGHRNDGVGLGERARVPRALVGVSPTTRGDNFPAPLSSVSPASEALGGTPRAATETVALPFAIASFRLGPSSPNSQRLQFVGCLPCPILVRRRTGGAGVKNFSDFDRDFGETQSGPLLSEVSDPDEPLGPQDLNRTAQMPVAGGEQWRHLCGGQFVRSQVAAVFVEERQGTVVDDEVVGEKVFSGVKAFRKQTPQPVAANFRAWAGKTFDETIRMFATRFANGRLDLHPSVDGAD